jgi:spore germination protein GerM
MIATHIGRTIIIVVIVLAIILLSLYIISRWTEMKEEEPPPEVQRVPEETRSVTLFFASREADRLLAETHEIGVEEGLEPQVKSVIAELLGGPEKDDKVTSIPPGAAVRQVFWEEESQTVFLDFTRTLVSNHPGGSTAEYYTISMILRTIGANFPQVRKVQFLVDGYPIETLAGHYAVDEPLDIFRWK